MHRNSVWRGMACQLLLSSSLLGWMDSAAWRTVGVRGNHLRNGICNCLVCLCRVRPAHPVWIIGRAGLGQGGGKQGHSAGTRPTTPALTTGCHPVLYHTCRLGLRLRLEALRLLLPGRSEERSPELDLELQCRAQAEQQVERFNFALVWLCNGGGRFEDD